MTRASHYWIPAIVVVGGLGCAVFAARQFEFGKLGARQTVAEFLVVELDDFPDEKIPAAMQQLARQQQPGWQAMVTLLKHERRTLAELAAQSLKAELRRAQSMDRREASQRVAWLAAALSAEVEQFSPAQRRLAGEIAEILLEWPLDSSAVSGPLVIVHCERVIRANLNDVRIAQADTADQRGGTHPFAELPDSARGLPGGGLPIERVGKEHKVDHGAPPGLEPTWPRELRPVPADAPYQNEGSAAPAGPPAEFAPPIAPRLPRPPSTLPNSDNSALPLSLLTDFSVIQCLHAEPESRAQLAEQELRRRGYAERHLGLARKLGSPDAELRAEACEELASDEGPHVRAWLLQLARDEDARVRRVAVGMLATTQDIGVHAALRSLRLTERDPQVRAMLEGLR